jgi:DNA-binding CsgD family transcriptional regulator
MNKASANKFALGADEYHQLLAHHDIYFIAFNNHGEVIDSNYPAANLNLETVNDLVFLIGPQNIAVILEYISTPQPDTRFNVANLKFELSTLSTKQGEKYYCLNIEASSSLKDESALSSIEQDYQIIQDLSVSLNILNETESGVVTEQQRDQIRNQLLPEVEHCLLKIKDPSLKLCIELVQSSMQNLLSGERGMNQNLLDVLTPSELQVAEFIRSGMSSQEIASTLNVARKTVENHRNSLRNKLGIKNRGVNLRNYLVSLKQSQ